MGGVDADGEIVREAKVRSEREALVAFFAARGLRFGRIGLEAVPFAVAARRPGGGRSAGAPDRDPARQGGAQGDDREDRPQ